MNDNEAQHDKAMQNTLMTQSMSMEYDAKGKLYVLSDNGDASKSVPDGIK